MEIIPAILANDEDAFREKLQALEGAASLVQIDVMDGFFTANESWYRPGALLEFPDQNFELHLMVEAPGKYIQEAVKTSNVTRIIWHVEADADHEELIARCHAAGKRAGLAISPGTPLEKLAPFISTLDEVLVLGVEPGASGQKLKPQSIDTARSIHALWPKIIIGFDGGVEKKIMEKLKAAGVSRACAASAIFESKNPARTLLALAKSP